MGYEFDKVKMGRGVDRECEWPPVKSVIKWLISWGTRSKLLAIQGQGWVGNSPFRTGLMLVHLLPTFLNSPNKCHLLSLPWYCHSAHASMPLNIFL